MTARTLPWFEDDDPRDVLRWGVAAAIVVTVHAAAIGSYLLWHQPEQELGDDTPIISVELTAPQIEQQEQPQVEAPTPPKETAPDAVLPQEKPPEQVQQPSPATRTTMEEQASAPRIDPSWAALVSKQIQRFKSYPVAAKERNEQGMVVVAINVGRDGHVLTHRIARSSGHPDLDAAAIASIEQAQPLPAFPASMTQSEFDDLEIPLHYILR
jgi:periplasmic protein TonB